MEKKQLTITAAFAVLFGASAAVAADPDTAGAGTAPVDRVGGMCAALADPGLSEQYQQALQRYQESRDALRSQEQALHEQYRQLAETRRQLVAAGDACSDRQWAERQAEMDTSAPVDDPPAASVGEQAGGESPEPSSTEALAQPAADATVGDQPAAAVTADGVGEGTGQAMETDAVEPAQRPVASAGEPQRAPAAQRHAAFVANLQARAKAAAKQIAAEREAWAKAAREAERQRAAFQEKMRQAAEEHARRVAAYHADLRARFEAGRKAAADEARRRAEQKAQAPSELDARREALNQAWDEAEAEAARRLAAYETRLRSVLEATEDAIQEASERLAASGSELRDAADDRRESIESELEAQRRVHQGDVARRRSEHDQQVAAQRALDLVGETGQPVPHAVMGSDCEPSFRTKAL